LPDLRACLTERLSGIAPVRRLRAHLSGQ